MRTSSLCVSASFVIGTLSSVLLAASPAFANTYDCDNDRSASQYPNCSTSADNGWVLRTGQTGDRNGDDRLGGPGTNFYNWQFTGVSGGPKFTIYAWLANVAFTDPHAEYRSNGNVVGYVNQNTAPSGWMRVGRGLTGPSIRIQVANASGGARTGADLVRVETDVVLATESALDTSARCGNAAVMDPRVAAVQQQMLNATDRYRDIKGTFRISFPNAGQNERVDFEVSERLKSSSVRITDRTGNVVEHVSSGQSRLERNPSLSTFREKRLAQVEDAGGVRHYHSKTCEPIYVHRQDPAWGGVANEVTSPENYAFWLTGSESRVVGKEMLLGRVTNVISGQHDAYLGEKLRATTFTMWVDSETGVLLKLAGTDPNGRLAYSIDVDDIRFDPDIAGQH